MNRNRIRLALLVAGGLLFFIVPSLVGFYVDWLWFGEVGYRNVFNTELATRSSLLAFSFVVSVLWLYGNWRVALQTFTGFRPLRMTTREGLEIAMPGREQVRQLAAIGACLVGLLVGLFVAGQWLTWLSFRHATAFGSNDPVLGRDIGFYVFTLPLLEGLRGVAMVLLIVGAAGSAAIYVLSRAMSLSGTGFSIGGQARRHLSILAAVFFLLLAFGAYLDIPQTLTTASGIIHGAAYTDVAARFPAAWARVVAALAAALLALWHASSPRLWRLPAAAALYMVVLLGGQAYAAVIQRFVVAPNEQVRETPFIVHNIAATRKAFALDRVDERELSGDASLTRQDIENNAATLKNVRLWDHQPLLDTFSQIQEIRTYYDFASVDNDRYTINGEYRQIMLSARELASSSLPNRNWINERLTFTHGYGVTLGPVNQVTEEGLPVLFIKNLPPESTVDLTIEEPSIYFGELSNDYVFVRTRAREFHYPKGDDNVYSTYTGTGGVPVGTLWHKLLYAIRFRSLKILLSDDLTSESRILMYRNIRERVDAIAPFLTFDSDPYMVVAEGRLFWILDAYTMSSEYPYSSPAANGINYVRNSVKAVVDAYNGTTTFYLSDANDPIVRTYAGIFPGVFRPLADMPASIRQHVRYPEDIFTVQAAMISTYHMTNPAVFYNKEDQWEVPSITDDDRGSAALQPYYTIMKLPGESRAEFIQILPFTPRRKDNLSAWMVARSDGDHYGHMLVFQFPKQKVVFGPRQVVARINQDQVISPQITLWNQQGSQVLQGTLLVIPIEESLIYIRPLYLRGTGGKIPELKRVIVAYQGQIVMEDTLEAALGRLFGTGPVAPPTRESATPTTTASAAASSGAPVTDRMSQLAASARDHYQRALTAQRSGDWALYGEELKRLGEVLQQMATGPKP